MRRLTISFRSLRSATFFCLFSLTSSFVFSSGPLVNDVGNGAFLWGTSSERTTYLGPYLPSTMAPTIRKIPEETNSADPWQSGTRSRADLWKTSEEVGSVIGTDGKIYRYRYLRGIEPRRVVETRVVDGQTVNVERIAWEPVVIRVLEPMTAEEKTNKANAASTDTPAPCEPNATLPKPCEPAGDAETTSETGAAGSNGASNANPNVAPSLNGSSESEVYDPTVGKPSQIPGEGGSSAASSSTEEDGVISVTVVTRDSKYPTQTKRPIVTIPKNGIR